MRELHLVTKVQKNLIYINNKRYKIIKKFSKLQKTIDEIKYISNKKNLDVEFAINKQNKVFILQIRALNIPKIYDKPKINIQDTYEKLEKKINKLKKNTILFLVKLLFLELCQIGSAEIIGIKPKPLALSLYRELITDHIWAENRKIYGYHDLSQFHLMTTFFSGTPFVDVRIDFNSWIPKKLDKKFLKNSSIIICKTLKKNNIYMIKSNLKSFLVVYR